MTADPEDPTGQHLQAQTRALRSLARSLLGTVDGADDVVQEALAASFASRRTIGDRTGFLVRVVQNLARRTLRSRARRAHRHGALPPRAPAPSTDDVLAQVEQHRLVADAVLQLREPYRRAVVLRFWHDLPPRAIAERLGLPVATVKTHLQRGLAELRERLARHAGDERAWLLALAPVAWPRRFAIVGSGASLPLLSVLSLLIAMNAKLLVLGAVACCCAGLVIWQPWVAPLEAAPTDRQTGEPGAVAADLADEAPQEDAQPTPAAAAASTRIDAHAAKTCTVVGRVTMPGDIPVPDARIRLLPFLRTGDEQPTVGHADRDGRFAITVPHTSIWILFDHVLVDAPGLSPGWAVREVALDANLQGSIENGRMDLGTLELERGVAVRGRVVEADGAPLRSDVTLWAWDPTVVSSSRTLFDGRVVGEVAAGGSTFTLDERMAANPRGTIALAAIGATGIGWADLHFAAGQTTLDPVEIRLLPGGAVDVRVVDQQGRPLAGARVDATPHFRPLGIAPIFRETKGRQAPPVATAMALLTRFCDDDGRARFVSLPRRDSAQVVAGNSNQPPTPGIVVLARLQGHSIASELVRPAGDGEAPAEVTITLRRPRTVTFHGTVTDMQGRPLAGVDVKPVQGDHATTDEAGSYRLRIDEWHGPSSRFTLEGGVVPRTFVIVEAPADQGEVERDFSVELRAPVTGTVVDQHGAPVAGVEVLIGKPGGMFYASTPERTDERGAFAFPDAASGQTELWITPPAPTSAWQWASRLAIENRDGQRIVLHRYAGVLRDLVVEVADARTGAPVSPTEVDVQPLLGDIDRPVTGPRCELAHGSVKAQAVRAGRYRIRVHAGDELLGEHVFEIADDATGPHRERVELWPRVAVVCTVDASRLPAAERQRLQGKRALVVLTPSREQSYCVDEHGARRRYTENTGVVTIGGDMQFRLEGVTAGIPLQLRAVGDAFGEAPFTAKPGGVTEVTLHLEPHGTLTFALPTSWPAGHAAISVRRGDDWHVLWQITHKPDDPATARLQRPIGETHWRVQLWPTPDADAIERTGTLHIEPGALLDVPLN